MVTGVAELHAWFARIPQAIIQEVVPVMEREATVLVAEMKALVPKDELVLMNSIRWAWDGDPGGLSVGAVGGRSYGKIRLLVSAGDGTTIVLNSRGTRFQNARIQEFGTRTKPAQAYFYPVYRANRTRIRSNISRAVSRAFKKMSAAA